MKRYSIILLFLGLFIIKASATNNKILIVSSYGSDYKWSNRIIEGIDQKLKKTYPGVEINVEFLSSEFLEDPDTWGEKMDILLQNYDKRKPQAIVLISDEAWMAYQAADTEDLVDVPLVLCAVKPHTIDISDFAKNRDSLSLANFVPTREAMEKYNATGILREMNVSGFLSLMVDLIDGLNRFVFITDSRFYGIYTHVLLQQEVKKNYPNIPVEYIDARFVSTDSLLSKLPLVPSTAGVLLTSWLTGEHGFEYSKDYIYSQMESKLNTPIFITNNIGLEKEYFLGGYFNDALFWGDETADILIDIFREKKPKEMKPILFHDDQCYISWKVFNHYGLNSAKLPVKVVFYNQPESFFVVYKYYIIGGSIALLIFISFYLVTLRSNIKLKSAQRRLFQAIEETKCANVELKKTHKNLIAALQKAEESDRLKTSFLANMSHEIRTPLNAIVGFSSVIVEMDSKDERMMFADQIQSNSDLLLQLISDILDISKVEAGILSLTIDSVDAKEICNHVITSLRAKCKPGVTLSLKEPVSSMIINTDQNRLMQVIINLTNNAIKFTSKGSIEVGFFSYNEDVVEFFVKDTGIGIAKEKLSTVFDRFVKLNSYVEGTGLGLSICKTMVEMLHGEIGIESTVGKGTRFWFRIPRNGFGMESFKEEDNTIDCKSYI